MTVLVDTSVWIRFLAGKEPYGSGLDRLLAVGDVVGHDFVLGELLIGDRGGRKMLLESFVLLPQARTVLHDEVVAFVRHHKLHGRGVGWIDIHLLASALVEGLSLWTADPRLDALAEELGVSFRA